MDVAVAQAPDSGVETECDNESNDSSNSMSSMSVGASQANEEGDSSRQGELLSPEPPPPPTSSPSLPSTSPLPPPPPRDEDAVRGVLSLGSVHNLQSTLSEDGASMMPMAAEDGYLGDCSSDGGNEKNFPLPADYRTNKHVGCSCHPHRHSLPPSPHRHSLPPSPLQQIQIDTSPPQPLLKSPPPPHDDIDPPAGLQFSALTSSTAEGGGVGYGYQILGREKPQHNLRTKLRSTGLRSKYNAHVGDDWSRIKTAIADRKLRGAASTNNTELVEQMCANGANVRCFDDHKRSPLHFAAAMGYTEVADILLKYGADPNQKDKLGNTALHLAACTNHVPVVTLLLRAGTDITTIDNNGRTPMQLAQAKLKIIQRNNSKHSEMSQVKGEVSQVLEMMREYLKKVLESRDTARSGSSETYSNLIDSFSKRLNLHTTHSDLTNDLGLLLDSLGDLHLSDST